MSSIESKCRILFIKCLLAAVHSLLEGQFKSCPGKLLLQDVVSSWNALSERHCSAICILQPECFGYNLAVQDESNHPYKCEILASNLLIASCNNENLLSEDGVNFHIKGKYILLNSISISLILTDKPVVSSKGERMGILRHDSSCGRKYSRLIDKTYVLFRRFSSRITFIYLYIWYFGRKYHTIRNCSTAVCIWWTFWTRSMHKFRRIQLLHSSRNKPNWMSLRTWPMSTSKFKIKSKTIYNIRPIFSINGMFWSIGIHVVFLDQSGNLGISRKRRSVQYRKTRTASQLPNSTKSRRYNQ